MLNTELKNRNIPCVLSFPNGEKITDVASWEKRRVEILEELQNEMYGRIPQKPKSIKFEEVSNDDFFCAGKANLRKINITCELENGTFTFPVSYTEPTEKPEITFVQINFRPQVPDKYQPTEELIDNKCAILSFYYEDITSDDGDFSNGLSGILFPGGVRNNSYDSGKISMWAWAAMRVMDYIETLDKLDSSKVVVIGHSRLGKTALVTAAMDSRFMSAASNDSGCCGAAIIRGKVGETYKDIDREFGYWFCPKFKNYVLEKEIIPFDQHYLLSAIAPRKLYVASAEKDIWADPKSEFLSCIAASEVYKLYGLSGLVHNNEYLTAPDCLHDGEIGYHIRKGLHYFSRTDWLYYLKYYLG